MILKSNTIYDIYEGEAPVAIESMTNPKPLAIIGRASWQKLGSRVRGEDSQAVNYAAQCKSAGIKYGIYHFLTPNGIAEQAALFLSVWDKIGGADLAPIVDVEVNLPLSYPHATRKGESSIGNAVWQGHIKTFIDLISSGTGKTPIIYTSQNYWKYACTTINGVVTAPVWTDSYPLWVAQYPTNPDTATAPAALPLGWTSWYMWQYNDKGRTNGFLANDLNTASSAFAAELGQVVIEDPVDEPATSGIPSSLKVTFEMDDGTIINSIFDKRV